MLWWRINNIPIFEHLQNLCWFDCLEMERGRNTWMATRCGFQSKTTTGRESFKPSTKMAFLLNCQEVYSFIEKAIKKLNLQLTIKKVWDTPVGEMTTVEHLGIILNTQVIKHRSNILLWWSVLYLNAFNERHSLNAFLFFYWFWINKHEPERPSLWATQTAHIGFQLWRYFSLDNTRSLITVNSLTKQHVYC